MTREELWTEQISFYQDLINKYKFEQKPMLFLIEKLHEAGLCEKLFPSNSHEALGLSLFDNYEDRCVNPMIYVSYKPRTNLFTIYYQAGQGKTISNETAQIDLTQYDLSKIASWLTNPTMKNNEKKNKKFK